MKRAIALALMLSVAPFTAAQTGGMQGMDMKDMDMKGTDKGAEKKKAQFHHGVGTVKSVDASKGTVTIDHGPIGTINWPAMTMTFKTEDKKMLEGAAPGKKVEFDFVKRGKDHVITKMK